MSRGMAYATTIDLFCPMFPAGRLSADSMLASLWRPMCSNGLCCRLGDFGIIRVPHRKSIVTDVVAGALQITAQFDRIGATVQAMAERVLTVDEQLNFARATFEIRWVKVDTRPRSILRSSCRCGGRRTITRLCGTSITVARRRRWPAALIIRRASGGM
jgi:hypothetical protein